MNITAPSVASKRSFSKEVNRLKANQQLLTILVLLFICMIFWIIVSLFSSQNSTKISPEVQQMAKPFNPTLDATVLDTLDGKRLLTDEELSSFPIFIIQRNLTDQTETIVELNTGRSIENSPVTTPPTTSTTQPTTTPVETENTTDTVQ